MNTQTIRIIRMAGREVVHTGKVAIGAAHIPPAPRQVSKDAERLQTALLDRRTAEQPAAWRRVLAPFWRWC